MKTDIQKFEERYIPEPNSGCWLWVGASVNGEKGHFRMRGREWIASRAAWELYRGPIPEGAYVLHHCDNPWCVNPGHLYIGSQTDNMQDAKRRNRLVTPGGWNRGLEMPSVRDFARDRSRTPDGRFTDAI